MNRIDRVFMDLRNIGQKALIAYITAGYPDIDATVELVHAISEAGADIVEIGIPYSDPLADGPVLQRAASKALEKGLRVCDVFDAVRRIRKRSDIALVFLVYFNTVFRYGVESFIKDSKDAGIDGFIIPDLPLEERNEASGVIRRYGLHHIPMVAPTSHERIKEIVKEAGGFVYCVSTTGVTGERDSIDTDISAYMEEVKRFTDLPRAIGFGISSPEMAGSLKHHCEGVIVGSAIARLVDELYSVRDFVKSIKKALE